MLARAFDVPQLDAEQHIIDRPDRFGVVGRLGRHEMRFAAAAHDFEAAAFHCRQMRAARDEGHVRSRLGKGRAKSTADAARAHHRDLHLLPPQIPMTLARITRPLLQASIVEPVGPIRKP